jgi:galactokinase/mevalonate kinase-like predicted kinase
MNLPETPQTLISVPPSVTPVFQDVMNLPNSLARHDPPGSQLGSGGGTAHLLQEGWRASGEPDFASWLTGASRILLHAGGQSRRLPAYAPMGKALMPIPVFRWSTGQRLDQTLLDLQLPLLRALLKRAPASTTLVASGDVLVWNEGPLPDLPEVDVLCVGLWSSPEVASNHGVFFTPRSNPEQFDTMLQKPSVAEIQQRSSDSLFLLDVGIWLFSPRAVEVLFRKCGWDAAAQSFPESVPDEFDLYSAFGESLGRTPHRSDPEISSLSCALLPLSEGEFYHFGTSRDMIRSALALQNRVNDPRRIRSPLIKPHPAIFVQEAFTPCPMTAENQNIWIENSHLGEDWVLRENHVLTGIPENDWPIDLPAGVCLDIVPLRNGKVAVRPYGFNDPFRGDVADPETVWMGKPAGDWFRDRGLELPGGADLQETGLFPVCAGSELTGEFIQWLLTPGDREDCRSFYRSCAKISAAGLSQECDLEVLCSERKTRIASSSLPALARHAHRSVFYQVDLQHTAEIYAEHPDIPYPAVPDPSTQLFPYMHDRMFRARVQQLRGESGDEFSQAAFHSLREAIIAPYKGATPPPHNTALGDQVIWARSPVRLDLAGGWTDTPPACFLHGGCVVNAAVELNGQPPIQVFARVGSEPRITLRSIDLGITQHLESYDDILSYGEIGSGFSIPKAALALAGFHPEFQSAPCNSLREQLEAFGGGLELSLLCAVPKGSGLGTSSILAATVLGALSECCGLGWDLMDIGNRTLALEQMLTSGGGWQDQFGGITHGLKMIRTTPGLGQIPEIRWLPDHTFTSPALKNNLLLYYTGLTRVAKDILAEIVQGMFLNQKDLRETLEALALHAEEFYEVMQRGAFAEIGPLIQRTWELNQSMDPGTNPPQVQSILASIEPELTGAKLLGAGGGGYLLLCAKNATAAARVRQTLESAPPNPLARFVDFELSTQGLQVTRS